MEILSSEKATKSITSNMDLYSGDFRYSGQRTISGRLFIQKPSWLQLSPIDFGSIVLYALNYGWKRPLPPERTL